MLIPGTYFQLLAKNAVSIWGSSTTYLQMQDLLKLHLLLQQTCKCVCWCMHLQIEKQQQKRRPSENNYNVEQCSIH